MAKEKGERLQRYLGRAGVCSRRKGEELILSGRVSVNGETVLKLGWTIVEGEDIVRVDGRLVEVEPLHLFLFHKPRGVVSTLRDPQKRPCIADYISHLPVRVYPVGRLDWDVSGLIVLTNDGFYAEHLLHPRYAVPRVYWARLRGRPSEATLKSLISGVKVSGRMSRADAVECIDAGPRVTDLLGRPVRGEGLLQVSVSIGRNHFVKDLLSAVGHPVVRLCRVSFGPYQLGDLAPGELSEFKSRRRLI